MFRKRKPKPKPQLPPVASAAGHPDLDVSGRRLGTLGMSWVKIGCACGHTGKIAVAALADRYGSETRVREAAGKMQCSRCGHARIRRITLSD